ncbi:hypothetical protein PMAYCL1PPCAC_08824, partial [Pristionchus mayeri]
MNSVRIDDVYPTVFEDLEKIEYSFTVPTSYQPTDDLKNYDLNLMLIFDGDLSLPTMTKINSVSLTVESTTVAVSKEVLGATSDFFSSLFYGNFIEKNSGSFVIKEVN